jgi:hypothetical protein
MGEVLSPVMARPRFECQPLARPRAVRDPVWPVAAFGAARVLDKPRDFPTVSGDSHFLAVLD